MPGIWVPALSGPDETGVSSYGSPAPYSWREVLSGRSASLDDLWVRKDSDFKAGTLQDPSVFPLWQEILKENPNGPLIEGWLRQGFTLTDLWAPFRGRFAGRSVDAIAPVPRHFENHPSTEPFAEWIDAEVAKGVRTGAMGIWQDDWGEPVVIHPLGVEPGKPRLIYDCRYVNLWLPDRPFSLPHVRDVALWASELAAFCDDKSGFYHCLLAPPAYRYMAFRWRGVTYFYRALPFGMKLSPWVYQLLSEAPVLFLRRHGFRGHVYVDDTLLSASPGPDLVQRMDASMFTYADLRSRLGWFLAREKSAFRGRKVVRHLGIEIDLERRQWRIPEDKILRFKARIEGILQDAIPSISSLQHVAGNISFFAVAVPSAMLFARSLFRLIAATNRTGAVRKALSPEVREDLSRWLDLDDRWNGISWRDQDHVVLRSRTILHTDASLVQWAGTVLAGPSHVPRDVMGDVFPPRVACEPIHVLEMHGLRNAVQLLAPVIGSGCIRAFCDNQDVVAAFNHSGSRDARLNGPLKEIFDMQFQHGLSLMVEWIPSAQNAADAPSRDGWYHEGRLSDRIFDRVRPANDLAGPFTVDIMASAWNARCTRYYSRFRSPSAAGLDVFAQDTAHDPDGNREHCWCFPPFVMVKFVLAHLLAQKATFTIIVPERIDVWWPVLTNIAVWSQCIARVGEPGVVEFPPGTHRAPDALKESLWAFLVIHK